ncbi:hypothetical protein FRC08_011170 [Ceratobasidium sp. 394]|nr:hypothetical protein FRC08_011170 [Ceratobasidium sp. 394]
MPPGTSRLVITRNAPLAQSAQSRWRQETNSTATHPTLFVFSLNGDVRSPSIPLRKMTACDCCLAWHTLNSSLDRNLYSQARCLQPTFSQPAFSIDQPGHFTYKTLLYSRRSSSAGRTRPSVYTGTRETDFPSPLVLSRHTRPNHDTLRRDPPRDWFKFDRRSSEPERTLAWWSTLFSADPVFITHVVFSLFLSFMWVTSAYDPPHFFSTRVDDQLGAIELDLVGDHRSSLTVFTSPSNALG